MSLLAGRYQQFTSHGNEATNQYQPGVTIIIKRVRGIEQSRDGVCNGSGGTKPEMLLVLPIITSRQHVRSLAPALNESHSSGKLQITENREKFHFIYFAFCFFDFSTDTVGDRNSSSSSSSQAQPLHNIPSTIR